MNVVDIKVQKALVLDEVAKTTSYAGAKAVEDAESKGQAYERIFTSDADRVMLERFWLEACSSATDSLRPWLVNVSDQPATKQDTLENDYTAVLWLPDNWRASLTDSIQGSLFSYFANVIVGKWMMLASKEDAEAYLQTAAGMLQDVELKLYQRKRPTRPVYRNDDDVEGDVNEDVTTEPGADAPGTEE